MAADEHQADAQAHANTATYLTIFAILFVITVVEVGIFYVGIPRPVLVSVLIVLSAAKFVLVVGYFMHLKFDSPVLRLLFAGPVFIALAIGLALLFLFGVFRLGV
jgi:cytochrome c oxidase subunit 4